MDYRLLDDEVLLKFLKISDELAFKELYLRYWQQLYYAALNKINNKEVAEDIIQAVFTDLWEKRERHSIKNLPAYLGTSVKYQVINYIKSVISKKTHLSQISEGRKTEENSNELTLLVKELNEAIDKAINRLPEKTQTIFRLSRFERRSNKEISRIMDVSEKTVEYHITQSLKALRLCLRDFMLFDLLVVLFLVS
jgi:RNA polymerase sigma-70 factor (ECF subfamily)